MKPLIKLHTTEKALTGQKLNKYVFKVDSDINKISIAGEIKKQYKVKPLSVNVINVPRKSKKIGKTQGFRPGYKKAVVSLAPGQTIEIK
ncbi:MAG: 50S ribosomal protein L23 [Candidatus Azambacteria bacterium GW2011_GWE1_42_9]|nr:MAG: 50S ribosomal protein L23 [Candidatus Azambacteria bacterium GW2011_GWF1_41_10]KKS49509.1 MAG: 50S ribosomal protein L23 [Candidatus Azambacteria bacterium GW2011_GWF2_42_22]KKS69616.1 MAG: 50S ribosomal protein L23 [Candidatus Azambacteria bacterium GW2011_GWA2_42_62]KKS74152.1 MAG: 50S ribosomal protein L23 [Candidatus Azambacteria bacterium GW2011_GWB1_42_72]KKS79528.1 MAG: 50S ribosomal protein L23 [Candidatus Azambacteria bacterium GW2011_GWE1_42_9]KKT03620.1 MAG: 50S ribosomal pr